MFEFSDTFMWIAVFAIISAVVNSIGIFAIFKYKKWAEKAKTYFMCFAAGVLISVPLMLAFPTGVEKNFYAGFFALLGYLFIFISNYVINYYTNKKDFAFSMIAVEGIALHSFVDGIIYTVTFQSSILIGILAATGLVVHEFAEGVITYLLLIKGGLKERTSILYALITAALTTPIGAFIAFPLVSKIGELELGALLGFTAGVLLYVSASHLLPEARDEKKEHSTIAYLAGVVLALFIVLTQLL